LPHARGGGHRTPLATSQRTLKTHKETMSGIWRSLEPKPKSATWSARRTTISTPNIISDRCARTLKGRKRLCCGPQASVASWASQANRTSLHLEPDRDSLPRLLSISYSTDWPSLSEFSPALSTAEILTNTSLPPLEANSPGLVTRERKCYIKSYGNRQTLSDGSEAPLVGTAPVHMGNI